jgi:CubicO group peptidase (beta-lactamase class C family)
MDRQILQRIDSIAQAAIAGDATPGAQVLVARHGKIVFQKAYGHHSYVKQQPVTDSSLYDVASLTKVMATLPMVMWLQEQGKVHLDSSLGTYLPDVRGSNKADMKIKDILTHQAGLMAFIPFWDYVTDKGQYDSVYLSNTLTERHTVEIAPNLYAITGIEDSVWRWTVDSRLTIRSKRNGMHRYFYSDLGFYLMKKLVEYQTGQPLAAIADSIFYRPLGLRYTTYHPLRKWHMSRIAPTEMDIYYRKSLVHGTVHDPGAALMGGMGGHAGLFSTAYDLAVLMQMHLQGGYYGGRRYLSSQTEALFNTQPYDYHQNRLAIGWDKPPLNGQVGNTASACSPATFGHTGFTGTGAWADPETGLVYIFLSNRVHPFSGNRKLLRDNVRSKIQQTLYDAIEHYEKQTAGLARF